MQVISLAKVKTFLGLTDDTQDAKIAAVLPVLDAKVKEICKNNFERQLLCKTVAGSRIVELYGVVSYRNGYIQFPGPELRKLMKSLPTGTQIAGDGIPADSYIEAVDYSGVSHDETVVPSFTINAEATESSTSVYLKAGISISHWPTLAKGVQYLINGQTTSIADDTWKSKSFGPVSITKADAAKGIDNASGMPFWFVSALPRFM